MNPSVRCVYWEWPLLVPEYARGMAGRRLVGSHFNKDGRPKRGYVKEEVAKAEAARFGMTYYRCDVCDRFHLASKS
jgi:hypothetical protein